MKKIVPILIFFASAMMVLGQSTNASVPLLDAAEDTTHIVTIADIVELQQVVTTQHSTSSHFESVWGNKSYFYLSYITSASLNPKESYELGFSGINNNIIPKFKADYGFALQLGHNYNLHKKPIANMVNINLDYSYIDLGFTHYKREPGEYVYDSDNNKNPDSSDFLQYMPWCLEKYDINYGMSIGPSVTVAPFTTLNNEQLHFLKFNIYYHIGYQAGILWMINDKDADAADDDLYSSGTYGIREDSDPLKLNWQHGFTQTFGFNLSWKSIGLGFEIKSDNRTYSPFDTSTFGSEKYKFKGKSSRIYLKICY